MPSMVTDPELLSQLNASDEPAPAKRKMVTDPAILRQLNGKGDVGVVEDVARTIPAGLARGVGSTVATPGMLGQAADWLLSQSVGRVENYAKTGKFEPTSDEEMQRRRDMQRLPRIGADAVLTHENVQGAINKVPGLDYQPQTRPGKYANTAAEFAPGMALGSGGVGARLAQTMVPAAASETAGWATEGTPVEPYARAGAAVVAGLGAGLATQPRTAHEAVSGAMRGADRQSVAQAQGLMDDAARMGVPLTWDEAIQHVTGGATRLTDLRRVVENSEGGGAVLKPQMAQRAGQVQQSADQEIGALAPQRMDPVRAGLANQRSANDVIGDTQANINRVTRPDYAAAERQSVTPPIAQALQGDPLYARTLDEIRGDPSLNRTIAHLPDDNVGVVDLVQRRMRETADNARLPGQASTSNLRAANFEDARTPAIEAAEQATGGRYGDYARARATQEQLRRDTLEPLTEGPVGAVAGTSDIAQQGKAVLPSTPAPGSEAVVADTVRRLGNRDQQAVENLVHSHIRSAFDEATQNNVAGPNQFGGAKFAAAIRGNGQQARNLEAAVTALPNGDVRWQGFNRYLDVLEASGRAPRMGSNTAFDTQTAKNLSGGGGIVGKGVEAATSAGTQTLRRIRDFYERVNMGRNTEQVARILTDPQAGRLLTQLADLPPTSARAQLIAVQLSYLGRASANSGSHSD